MFAKRRLITLIFLVSILFSACTPVATPIVLSASTSVPIPATAVPTTASTPMPPSATEPISIVQSYYDALNANDFVKVATLLDENVVTTDTSGLVEGKAKVLSNWQLAIESGVRIKLSELKNTDGRVTLCYQVTQNNSQIDEGCDGVTIVRGGLVLFDGLTSHETMFIVKRYYQAINDQNLDLALSFIADHAVFANPTGLYTGKEAIRASLEELMNQGITFELSNFHNTQGRVVYAYNVKQGDSLLDSGTDGLTIVKDGFIVFDGTEATESNAPAMSGNAPVSSFPEVSFSASDTAFTGPTEVEGGWVKIVLTNEGQEPHHLQLVKLLQEKTTEDLKIALSADGENFPSWSQPYDGPNAPDPGGITSAILFLEAGNYALIDVIPNVEGVPHFLNGLVTTLTVTKPKGNLSGEPQADITINLTDFAFLVSGELTPGDHLIHFNNAGKQVHEAFLVKLNEGATADDYLNTSPGEPPPGISLGGITGISPGEDQYLPVTLEAGEYALFCFFPDPGTHAPHFVQGMVMQFTVK